MQSLILFSLCVASYLEYMKNFSDNMEVHIIILT